MIQCFEILMSTKLTASKISYYIIRFSKTKHRNPYFSQFEIWTTIINVVIFESNIKDAALSPFFTRQLNYYKCLKFEEIKYWGGRKKIYLEIFQQSLHLLSHFFNIYCQWLPIFWFYWSVINYCHILFINC